MSYQLTSTLTERDLKLLEYIDTVGLTHVTPLRLLFQLHNQTLQRCLDRLGSSGYIFRPISGLVVSASYLHNNRAFVEWSSNQLNTPINSNYKYINKRG